MGILERDKAITIFKRIKSDLKTMYDILEENPQYENFIKDDIANVQRITSNTLGKLKKTISYERAVSSQKGLFDEEINRGESVGSNK